MAELDSIAEWSFKRFLGVLAVGIGVIFVVLGVLSVFIDAPFFSLSELVGAIGSLVLSAILAFIYVKISQTQSEQKELMDSQTKLMMKQQELQKAEHRPFLSVQKIRLTGPKSGETVQKRLRESELNLEYEKSELSGEKASVELANYGNGLATDLRLYCELEPLNSDVPSIPSLRRPLLPGGEYAEVDTGKSNGNLFGAYRNELPPSDTVRFNAQVLFFLEDPELGHIVFPSSVALDLLRSQGVEYAMYRLRIQFRNINGDLMIMDLLSEEVDLEGDDSIRDQIGEGQIQTEQDYQKTIIPKTAPSTEDMLDVMN